MTIKKMNFIELCDYLSDNEFPDDAWDTLNVWFERGDGVAVYQNVAFDHSEFGRIKVVSFGSQDAQLEVDDPPQRLPDIGNQIHWAYQLQAVYRPEKAQAS